MATGQLSRIDYQVYRFGRSRQRFRGPKPDLSQPYMAFIGGSEVYGRFVPRPFPDILQQNLDFTCANWGTPGAGPSFFLKDPVVLEACSQARVCVITAMGAVAMSNRLYSVFKRRNSRVRDTSEMLRALYPRLNLSEFRFAHNMLRRMYRESPEKFEIMSIELQQAWVARMRELLDDIETVKVLLWMSGRSPDDKCSPSDTDSFVNFPAFVTREMFEKVAVMADLVVEYVADKEVSQNRDDGRVFDDPEHRPALDWPGPTMHAQTAALLQEPLREVLSIKSGKWF